jgi:putative flippase GtrA
MTGRAAGQRHPGTREELSQLSLIRDTYLRFQVLVHEIAKFGVVGALGFVVQIVIQNALYPGHGIGAFTAVVIASAIATTVTFLGNRFWAFKHRKGKGIAHESALFILFNVVGILIQAGIVDLGVHVLHDSGRLAYNVFTIIGIGIATVFRLFCYRKFVFHEVRVDEALAGLYESTRP